jgi:hypothetical protein
MTDSFGFASEDFLASTADLVSVLAHLVDSSNPHSSQRRSGQRLEAAALSTLLRNIPTVVQLPPPLVPLAGPAPVPQRIVAHKAARTAEPSIPVEAMDCRSRAQRRQYCRCGQCKRCMDNLRWDRIYNEKFADPAYYGGRLVRHNSALGGAR